MASSAVNVNNLRGEVEILCRAVRAWPSHNTIHQLGCIYYLSNGYFYSKKKKLYIIHVFIIRRQFLPRHCPPTRLCLQSTRPCTSISSFSLAQLDSPRSCASLFIFMPIATSYNILTFLSVVFQLSCSCWCLASPEIVSARFDREKYNGGGVHAHTPPVLCSAGS